MDIATIEQLRDEHAAVEERLEAAIVQAHADDARISDIATAAGMNRPKVYRILHEHGIEFDAELGRRLVGHRWTAEREAKRFREPAESGVAEYARERLEHADPPDRDLFAEPADGDPEPEINLFDFVDRTRAQIRARAELRE